jgi:O-acetyl-ADP-ribose deacetylase (regulator of RNase III)
MTVIKRRRLYERAVSCHKLTEPPMINLTQGDILSAEAEALVNTVNCVGVMGRGIALQFKKVFPDNFKRYKAICDRKELRPGKMFIHDLRARAKIN